MHSKTLLQILKPLAPAIDQKPVLPICESVLIMGGRAYATNTQLSISNKCDLPDMVLPYNKTIAILNVLNEEIEVTETGIKAGSKKFPLPKPYDANLFPDIAVINSKQIAVTTSDLFAINEAAKNTAADTLSPWQYIFLGNEFIVGNDNYAMFKYGWEKGIINIAIPKLFARAITGQKDGSISTDGKQLLFKSNDIEIIITLGDSKFPNFNSVFPAFKSNLSVLRGDFEIALRQSAVSAPDSVTLQLSKDKCDFLSSNGEFVDCAAKTDLNLEITFSPDKLSRIISSLPDECDTLIWMIQDTTKAAFIEYNNITLLIMPKAK